MNKFSPAIVEIRTSRTGVSLLYITTYDDSGRYYGASACYKFDGQPMLSSLLDKIQRDFDCGVRSKVEELLLARYRYIEGLRNDPNRGCIQLSNQSFIRII